ncbi:putative uncharacterized protein [Prevotella sp. CAG:1320]|nr:putative uncharacterized protein [Prevotella sp. CAG:1320]
MRPLRHWSTERISHRVLYALIGVTVVAYALFALVGFNIPYEQDPDKNAPLFTDLLLWLGWITLVLSLVLAVASTVHSHKLSPRQAEKNGIAHSLPPQGGKKRHRPPPTVTHSMAGGNPLPGPDLRHRLHRSHVYQWRRLRRPALAESGRHVRLYITGVVGSRRGSDGVRSHSLHPQKQERGQTMMIRRKRHEVPGLNTTSTADISFMLLIFFLVTTSMDPDKGLLRQLPPMEPKETVAKEELIEKRNLLRLEINSQGQLTADGQPITPEEIPDKLLPLARKAGKNHVVWLSCDPEANYDTYFQVQDQLVKGYAQWREEVSRQKTGKPYARLSAEQQATIRELTPQRVAEQDHTTEENNPSGIKEGGNP